jgi:hypothetical protein
MRGSVHIKLPLLGDMKVRSLVDRFPGSRLAVDQPDDVEVKQSFGHFVPGESRNGFQCRRRLAHWSRKSQPAKVRGKRRRGTTTLFVLHHEAVISAALDLPEQAKFNRTKARPSPVAAAEKVPIPLPGHRSCGHTTVGVAAGTRPLESTPATFTLVVQNFVEGCKAQNGLRFLVVAKSKRVRRACGKQPQQESGYPPRPGRRRRDTSSHYKSN